MHGSVPKSTLTDVHSVFLIYFLLIESNIRDIDESIMIVMFPLYLLNIYR